MNNKKTIGTQFKPSKNKLQQLFFAFIKKAEFLLAIDGFSSETPTVCCRHYPVRYRGHPFCKKGNSDRELLDDTTPSAIAATPSARRGILHRELLFVREKEKCWGKIPLF